MIFEAFAKNLGSYSLTVDEFCTRNEILLNHIIERWQGDVSPLVNAILPFGHWSSRRYDGVNATALHQRLSRAILPRLAAQVIGGLRKPGYVQRVWTHDQETHQIRCLFLDHEGPLWKDARKELLAVVQDAGSYQVIQENVHELLQWFEHGFDERSQTGDAESLTKLFLDKELLDALWAAATARPLGPYSTVRLNNFVLSIKRIGATVNLPPWWDEAIRQSGYKPNPVPHPTNQTSDNETDQTA